VSKPRTPLVLGGRVVDGEIVYDWPDIRKAAMRAWDGMRVRLTMEREEQTRSLRAHRYLFGVVYTQSIQPLFDAGYKLYTVEELHEIFKERHNPITVVDFNGVEKRVGGSTKKLPVEAFGLFIERTMCDLATMAGISFPEPTRHEDWRTERAA
jgi:hypothetical protein